MHCTRLILGSPCSQQDATEFMRLLINEMHEEWKALSAPPGDLSQRTFAPRYLTVVKCVEPFTLYLMIVPRPDLKTADTAWLQLLSAEKTDIAECFMGMYKSTIKCLTCSNEAVKFEPFWDLSVPFPQVGRDALGTCCEVFGCSFVLCTCEL